MPQPETKPLKEWCRNCFTPFMGVDPKTVKCNTCNIIQCVECLTEKHIESGLFEKTATAQPKFFKEKVVTPAPAESVEPKQPKEKMKLKLEKIGYSTPVKDSTEGRLEDLEEHINTMVDIFKIVFDGNKDTRELVTAILSTQKIYDQNLKKVLEVMGISETEEEANKKDKDNPLLV